jgi:hypothetical protein
VVRRVFAALVALAGGCAQIIGATEPVLDRCNDGIIGNQVEGDCGGTDGVIDIVFTPDCPLCKAGQRCFVDDDCAHGGCLDFACEGCFGKGCSGDPCTTSADCGEGTCNLISGVCSTFGFCQGGCGSGCEPSIPCAPGKDCAFEEDCGAGALGTTSCRACEVGMMCPCITGQCCLYD